MRTFLRIVAGLLLWSGVLAAGLVGFVWWVTLRRWNGMPENP